MANATSSVSPLRRRMIDDMTLHNLSPATQRSYIDAVIKFARHCKRSPDRLGLEDVRSFQVYLVSQCISLPALNQTGCALCFFYGVTLNRAEIPERVVHIERQSGRDTILRNNSGEAMWRLSQIDEVEGTSKSFNVQGRGRF